MTCENQIGRDGRVRKHAVVTQPAIKGGMRSRILPSAEIHHGAPVTYDEPNLPIKSHEKPIPVHGGMTDRQRAALHPLASDPHAIMQDAAALGRRK